MKSVKTAIIIILTFLVSLHAEAQSISNKIQTTFVATSDRMETDMKTATPNHAKIINPDVKIVKNLLHLFPLSFDQKWWIMEGYHHVSFINENQKGWAVFTPKGKLSYAVVNCNLEQLPHSLQRKITNSYSSYSILQSLEINANDLLTHQVILESEQRYVTLKATTNGIEETASMISQK